MVQTDENRHLSLNEDGHLDKQGGKKDKHTIDYTCSQVGSHPAYKIF